MKNAKLKYLLLIIIMSVSFVSGVISTVSKIFIVSRASYFSVIGSPPITASRQSYFSLDITIAPKQIFEDSDAEITVVVSHVISGDMSGQLEVRVESESFKIIPSESRTLKPVNGALAHYVVTPKGRGDKKLRVYARYIESVSAAGNKQNRTPQTEPLQSEYEQVVTIEVRERSALSSVSKEFLSMIQLVSAGVGLPSLLLLFVTRWLDHKKQKKKDEDEPKSKIILLK